MKAPEKTLNNIKKTLTDGRDEYRVSDFVSREEVEQLHKNNLKRAKTKENYDPIDAMEAEIVARFGYEVYKDWQSGELDNTRVVRWILAERARDAQGRVMIESVIANGFSACYQTKKGGRSANRGISKIIKRELKTVKGEN